MVIRIEAVVRSLTWHVSPAMQAARSTFGRRYLAAQQLLNNKRHRRCINCDVVGGVRMPCGCIVCLYCVAAVCQWWMWVAALALRRVVLLDGVSMDIDDVRELALELMAEHGLLGGSANNGGGYAASSGDGDAFYGGGASSVGDGRGAASGGEASRGAAFAAGTGDGQSWAFGFDHARKRAGQTNFSKRQITLSAPLMRIYSEEAVRGVILHEIAHALVGAGHHHDATWKRMAVAIGAQPRASLNGMPHLPPLWQGRCAAGHQFARYRRPQVPASCVACAREAAQLRGATPRWRYDERYRISWRNRKTGERI